MNFFNTVVRRVSNFSIQSYDRYNNDVLTFFKSNQLFQFAVLVASKTLYDELNKGKTDKTLLSLQKYFNRAHHNPTPFAAFSSVGVLYWGKDTEIKKSESLLLSILHDNKYISKKIIDTFNKNWLEQSYNVNPTLRTISGNKITFFKSEFVPNDRIEIKSVELDFDENLETIITQINNQINLNSIFKTFLSGGFDELDIKDYFKNIIDSGLLISKILFDNYASKLKNEFTEFCSNIIKKSKYTLTTDSEIISLKNCLLDEYNIVLKTNSNSDKSIYSINGFEKNNGTLSNDIKEQLLRYIDFVHHYNSDVKPLNDKLNKFTKKITTSYNDGFVPLLNVFNLNSGINYTNTPVDFKLKFDDKILNKLFSSGLHDLILNLPLKKNLSSEKLKSPATYSIIIELLKCRATDANIIYIKRLGESSALNLISRFHEVTENICAEIVAYEKSANSGKLVADLNCLGNLRSINIAPEKQLYDYCIPINTSYSTSSNPILLDDIYFHLNNGNITLVSKSKKKEIIIKKTSAINHKLLDFDLYHFLCDFEFYQHEIHSINFDFNAYQHIKEFVPRIYLEKNVLLHPAQLLLIWNDLGFIEFGIFIKDILLKYSFSDKIIVPDLGKSLLLNTSNEQDLRILFLKLEEKKRFFVTESMYESFDPQIKNKLENFAHELVVSVKNESYFQKNYDYTNVDILPLPTFNIPLSSDWLYLELYCNSAANNELLKIIQNKIILKNKCDLFFFVNYSNPDRHLRLRFKTKSTKNKKYIIKQIQELQSNFYISKYQIVPYEQETYRYGGAEMMSLSETIFDLDSRDFLTSIIDKDLNELDVQMFAILKITNYLRFFNFTLNEAIIHCEKCIENFSKEFELRPVLRKSFNREYAEIKNDIFNSEYKSFLNDIELKIQYHNQIKISKPVISDSLWLLIHMSMNRHFNDNQRFNEFKTYYLTKSYLNQLKYTNQSF